MFEEVRSIVYIFFLTWNSGFNVLLIYTSLLFYWLFIFGSFLTWIFILMKHHYYSLTIRLLAIHCSWYIWMRQNISFGKGVHYVHWKLEWSGHWKVIVSSYNEKNKHRKYLNCREFQLLVFNDQSVLYGRLDGRNQEKNYDWGNARAKDYDWGKIHV